MLRYVMLRCGITFFLWLRHEKPLFFCCMIIMILYTKSSNGLFILVAIKSLMFVPHICTLYIHIWRFYRHISTTEHSSTEGFHFVRFYRELTEIFGMSIPGVPSIPNEFHFTEWNENNINLNVNHVACIFRHKETVHMNLLLACNL